jgi:hypothetical protein
MKLNDTARLLIGSTPATLVTINRDGSPQVSAVWMVVQSTADGDDQLVTAHLHEHQKIRNIRRDPPVDAMRAQAARTVALYGTLPSYRAMLDREGVAGPEDMALIGDEATVSDRIAELCSAGVDEFSGLPFGDSSEDRARTRALMRKVDSTP